MYSQFPGQSVGYFPPFQQQFPQSYQFQQQQPQNIYQYQQPMYSQQNYPSNNYSPIYQPQFAPSSLYQPQFHPAKRVEASYGNSNSLYESTPPAGAKKRYPNDAKAPSHSIYNSRPDVEAPSQSIYNSRPDVEAPSRGIYVTRPDAHQPVSSPPYLPPQQLGISRASPPRLPLGKLYGPDVSIADVIRNDGKLRYFPDPIDHAKFHTYLGGLHVMVSASAAFSDASDCSDDNGF